MTKINDEFYAEDFEIEAVHILDENSKIVEGEINENVNEDIVEIDEEVKIERVDFYLNFFSKFQTLIKDELIKQSMNVMFEVNPKFRKDDSLIISVYNILKQYFIEGKRHVFLNAPTGSGKTIIAFGVNFCFNYVTNTLCKIASYNERFTVGEGDGGYAYSKYMNVLIDENINVIIGNNGVMGFIEFDENNKPIFKQKIPLNINEFLNTNFDLNTDNKLENSTYLLTSSKLLQEQLDSDINEVFELDEYYAMLKGSSNYECTLGTIENKQYTNFTDRSCLNMNKFEKMGLDCIETCPYYVARQTASDSQTAILNYHYFLNVHRRPNLLFNKRILTIADEGHLLPDIVTSIFNIELTMYTLNRLLEVLDLCQFNFNSLNSKSGYDFKASATYLGECYKYFLQKLYAPNDIIIKGLNLFYENLRTAVIKFDSYLTNEKMEENNIFNNVIKKKYAKFTETYNGLMINDFINKISKNTSDLNYESDKNDFRLNLHKYEWFTQLNYLDSNADTYNHIFRNLDESVLVSENFVAKTDFTLQLSATFVDMETHANTSVGIVNENEYKNLNLPQQFEYKNSPIYVTKSGYLNYKNFDNEIDGVMVDLIKIVTEIHPNEKGIIHTASTRINNILKDKVGQLPYEITQRFLFYSNSQEKEQAIKMMYGTNFPYIICGYSLYEGLDLKHDLGRFNILVKVPYGGQSEYTKAKMIRYPKWYENDTIQKVCQAIGRTDRDKTDYSTTYLLDSMFDKFKFKLPKYLRDRMYNKTL